MIWGALFSESTAYKMTGATKALTFGHLWLFLVRLSSNHSNSLADGSGAIQQGKI